MRRKAGAALALAALLAGGSGLAVALPATAFAAPAQAAVTDQGLTSARAALERILGTEGAARFDLRTLASDGQGDRFEVKAEGSRIVIAATTPATALRGLNVYLHSVGQSINYDARNVSSNPASFVAPAAPLSGRADVAHRFYGNDTEDGYTGPYRTFEDWSVMIDDLAALGYNEVFVPVGSEAVYLEVLKNFGYTEQEALAWIPAPSHQPWWLLQNMSGYPAGITKEGVLERAALGKRIADRLRELDMTPVLPGFYGTVPSGFEAKNPGNYTVEAPNSWQGFKRSGWLDPNADAFPRFAADYYAESKRLLGSSTMFKMDVLHEGGAAGTVDVTPAATRIEDALQAAHPGATWVLLGWQSNPPAKVLAGVDPKTTFIVDGLSDRYNPAPNRESSFAGVPYAFGSIWNFGGDTAMGAQINTWQTRYWAMRNKAGSTLDGVAAIPEGGLNNAAALQFMADLAWSSEKFDTDAWFESWTFQRYGVKDPSAIKAWKTISRTAYALDEKDSFSEPHDSVYDGQPSFTTSTSSTWSPTRATYDMELFATALPELLAAAPAAKDSAAYRRDLMDVARQALTNTGRQLLPKLSKAYNLGELETYDRLSAQWLKNLELLDALAGTDQISLLGGMLDDAAASGTSAAEKAMFERSQKIILSTWADKGPSTSGGLKDYAGRDYQGLVKGLYAPRWKIFLDDQRAVIVSGFKTAAPKRDWWEQAQGFINSTSRDGILSAPQGDVVALAGETVAAIKDGAALEVTDPEPPAGGVSYLSDLKFADQEVDGAFGPIERDMEVGNAAPRDGAPITLNGKVYAKGLGMQARSSVTFNLGGKCSVFDAIAGVDDIMAAEGKTPSITFKAYGDGVLLKSSGELKAKQTSSFAGIDVTGVKYLKLELDPGASNWFDRGDWADAKVTCVDGTPAASLSASATEVNTHPGEETSLQLTAAPADAVVSKVTWTSSNPAVATAFGGPTEAKVLGRSAGTATLTGTASPGTAKVTIQVSVTGEYAKQPGAGVTQLSSLAFLDHSPVGGFGPTERDMEVGLAPALDGGPLRVAGQQYSRGLGMQAPSHVSFDLGARCTTFSAVVGPDEVMNKPDGSPSIKFKVYGDGVLLKETAVLYKGQSETISGLDVKGVSTLRLELDPAAGAPNSPGPEWFDRGDWADAKVDCQSPKVESVQLSANDVQVQQGKSVQVTASASPQDVAGLAYAFSVADDAVASVSADGATATVHGLKPGTTTLTVKATPGSAERTITVTVTAPPPSKVSSVDLGASSLRLSLGQSTTLNAALFPANVPGAKVSWSMKQAKVLSLEPSGLSAKITGTKPGTTFVTVTAQPGGVSQTIKVTVVPPQANGGK